MAEEIILPSRPFRDVHQLVFLIQSWQLILEEAELPPALEPLREIPADLVPVVVRMLRSARDQLEAAQAGTEIALRFPATPEHVAVLQWGAERLRGVDGSIEEGSLDPIWANALRLAEELLEGGLASLPAPETSATF